MTPRLGSLFSGYGGLDLAVEQFFGAETAWHCQYDPEDPHQYAARILAQHWPDVPNLGDITAVDWDQVEPVDILTGGFPCTDVSLAGQRAGLAEGTRSGLWAHMARAIAVLRPRLVVIENVPGLLSASADRGVAADAETLDPRPGPRALRALGAVLGDLAALGFDAEWASVSASEVGAPHKRERVFVLAWPADAEGPRLEVRGLRGRPGADGGPAAADADQLGAHRRGARCAWRDEPADHGHAAADTDGGRLAEHRAASDRWDAVRSRLAEDLGGCDQASADPDRDGVRVEPVAEPRRGGEAVAELAGAGAAADSASVGRGEGWTEPARLEGRPDPAVGGAPDWGVYEPAIRRWEQVLGRPAPGPVDDRGRLSPALTEWMQGLPEGWLTVHPKPEGMTDAQVRNAQLKAAGNGVVPQQAYAALGLLWARAITDQQATAA